MRFFSFFSRFFPFSSSSGDLEVEAKERGGSHRLRPIDHSSLPRLKKKQVPEAPCASAQVPPR